MSKNKRDPATTEGEKKKRKVITLDMKLAIIERFKRGESKTKIGKELGFNESTIRTILAKSDEYWELGKVASPSISMQCTRNRSAIMFDMENLLTIWLEECSQNFITINTNKIMAKALDLFSQLKETKYKEEKVKFTASKGWFENFKSRTGMKALKDRLPVSLVRNAIGEDFNLAFEGVRELLDSNTKDLCDDDLLEIKHHQRRAYNENGQMESLSDREENVPKKELTPEELDGMFRNLETIKQKIMNMDPDANRGFLVCQSLEDQIACYRRIYAIKKKEKTVQTTIDKYFKHC